MKRTMLAFFFILLGLFSTAQLYSADPPPSELFDLFGESVFANTSSGAPTQGLSQLYRTSGSPKVYYHSEGTNWSILDRVNEAPYYTTWRTELTPTEEGIVPYGTWEDFSSYQFQDTTTAIGIRTHTLRWDFVAGDED
ncbi:hypothetical protein KQI63_05150 [bacterium]|nr:hypothetical protein [bacterium]